MPKPWLWKVIIQADNNYIKNPVRTFNCAVSHDAVSRVLSGCWTRDTDGDDRCQSAAEMAQFRVSWLNRRSFPTIIMSNCRNSLSAFCWVSRSNDVADSINRHDAELSPTASTTTGSLLRHTGLLGRRAPFATSAQSETRRSGLLTP